MLGMNDMFADMVKKIIPPEVQELLTAEKLKEIGDQAKAFVDGMNATLAEIKETQAAMAAALLNIDADLVEIKKNDLRQRDNASGSGSGRGRRRDNGDSGDTTGKPVTGTGSGTE